MKKKVTVNEPIHARLAPSALKSYETCPAWQPIPNETSAAAEEGTLLHEYLENPSPKKLQELPAETRDLVVVLEGYVDDILTGIVEADVHRETRLDLTKLNIPGCTHGTADVLIWDQDSNILHLIDYKFGRVEVDDPETNPQIWAYALAAFGKYPKAESLTAHILQPRCDTIGTHTFTRADMPRMLVRLQLIAARAHAPKPQQIPTWDNCRFCNLLKEGRCGALTAIALRTIEQNELATVPKTLIHNDNLVMQQDVKALALSDAATLYDLANLLETWAKGVRSSIAFRDDADEIPGHSLVITNGKRSIRDPLGAREVLAQYGVTDEQLLSIADLPISKVEGLVGATAERGEKQKIIGEMSETLLAEGILDISNPVRYLRRSKTEETKQNKKGK